MPGSKPQLKPPPVLQNRHCLKCGNQFPSSGPGNRLCVFCNRENGGLAARGGLAGPKRSREVFAEEKYVEAEEDE